MNANGRAYIIELIGFGAFYAVQLSSWSWPEALVLAGGGAMAAYLVYRMRRTSRAHFAMRWSWYGILLRRLPVSALADSFRVLGGLISSRAGAQVWAVPYDKDFGPTGAAKAGHQALAICGATFAPNSVAISVDPRKQRMLLHQLVRTGQPPGKGDRVWPF